MTRRAFRIGGAARTRSGVEQVGLLARLNVFSGPLRRWSVAAADERTGIGPCRHWCSGAVDGAHRGDAHELNNPRGCRSTVFGAVEGVHGGDFNKVSCV